MNMFDSFKVIIASSIICCIALKLFGKDWKRVEDYIGTRTGAQIRSHAQKYFLRIEKELNGEMPEEGLSHGSDLFDGESPVDEEKESVIP